MSCLHSLDSACCVNNRLLPCQSDGRALAYSLDVEWSVQRLYATANKVNGRMICTEPRLANSNPKPSRPG